MDRENDRERPVSWHPASFADATRSPSNPFRIGVWIHDAERELKETRALVSTGNLPKADACRDLKDRFDKDAEVIKDVRGMGREAWERATPEQRLQSLNELEQRLAASQGRVPHRLYVIPGIAGANSPADLHMASLQRELTIPLDRRFEPQIRNRIVTEAEGHANGLATGKRIIVDSAFVDPPWGSSDVRDIAEHVFKACRYAYQHAVITNPERHPEVSPKVRESWQEGYVREARVHDVSHGWSNDMVIFAWYYAEDMRLRVYGLREWESPGHG